MKLNSFAIALSMVIILGITIPLNVAYNSEIKPQEFMTNWMKNLLSGISDKEKNAAIEATKERKHIIGVLSSIIKETVDKDNRMKIASAIKIAGIIRAEELVDLLVAKIDFLEYGIQPAWSPHTPVTGYIAVKSLIQIGKPSIQPLIKRLAKEKDNNNRIRCLFVVYKVEGEEFTNLTLQNAILIAEGEEKNNLEKSLEEAAKLIKNIK